MWYTDQVKGVLMLAEVGVILLGMALAVALYVALATFWAIGRDDARFWQSACNGVYAVMGLLGGALFLLLLAFMTDQFQIRYVADHSSRMLPIYLKASAIWAGQEGSLLLWAFLQALLTVLVMGRGSERMEPLTAWTMLILDLITAFFVAMTLFLSNPFVQTTVIPTDGRGLNPLLRHPGMIFHPPAMYLGYVGLAAPFAIAMAALIVGRVDDWPGVARRWTVA
ncbi:MAG TPA: hypothetical protein ENN19_19165, partial [Chloroflexi bacterium]|nr:hypothetical protein [Chloroflexota bacterium]